MSNTKHIGSLDYFKIISAFLVVAIHTSPFIALNGTIDFAFTRVFARIAVPFFFMITGYFLLPQYLFEKSKDYSRLLKYLKKTTVLYLVATIIYIPINIYAGHYTEISLLKLLKMIFFDGTFYHLWYLPASIIGVLFVCFLGKKICFKYLVLLCAFLYILGLLGDSYFILVQNTPILSDLYEFFFSISSYTRNGFFFAPIFLVMSALLHQNRCNISKKKATIGFIISVVLMLIEALTLRNFSFIRHDSMYIFLIPCLFFLFQLVLRLKLNPIKNLSVISLIIYIIHPFFIVAIRGVAKVLKLESILIENSLIHYLLVCFTSCVFAIVIEKLMTYKYRKRTLKERAWIELDFDNLRHNVKTLESLLPVKCSLMPVVKANAYGHGAVIISKELNKMGIRNFCVSTVFEGIELRKSRIKGEILILGYTHCSHFSLLKKYNLTQTIVDVEHMETMKNYNKKLKVHIKVNTGMNRLGESEAANILKIFRCKNLQVDGIYTHLSSCETTTIIDKMDTLSQYETFLKIIDDIKLNNYPCPPMHILSSYGLLNYPQVACDYVRIGIALYGEINNYSQEENSNIDLRPVLSIKSKIVSLKLVFKGETAGYSRAFVANRTTMIAILPIGYADGIPRSLSCGVGNVLINGAVAPIIGRICMDQMLVDVTDITETTIGDIAIIIGVSGENKISASTISKQTDSIPNEIFSRLGSRLEVSVRESPPVKN